MFNGTFLKPSTIDLLYRGVMSAAGVVDFCFLFLFRILPSLFFLVQSFLSACTLTIFSPIWPQEQSQNCMFGLTHESKPNLGRRGAEPSAQGSGKGARPSRHMGSKDALRGFDVRTDHLLIIHGSGRSQGRTLSVYCARVACLACYVGPDLDFTSGEPRG